jgi:hypothetical protein
VTINGVGSSAGAARKPWDRSLSASRPFACSSFISSSDGIDRKRGRGKTSVEGEFEAETCANLASNPSVSLCFEEAGVEIQTVGLKAATQAAIPDANANAAVIRTTVPENEIPRPNGGMSAVAAPYVILTYVIHPPVQRLGERTGFQGNHR